MGYEDYLEDEDNHRKNAKQIIRTIEKYVSVKKQKVLDIGCAHGFCLDEFRKINIK